MKGIHLTLHVISAIPPSLFLLCSDRIRGVCTMGGAGYLGLVKQGGYRIIG